MILLNVIMRILIWSINNENNVCDLKIIKDLLVLGYMNEIECNKKEEEEEKLRGWWTTRLLKWNMWPAGSANDWLATFKQFISYQKS